VSYFDERIGGACSETIEVLNKVLSLCGLDSGELKCQDPLGDGTMKVLAATTKCTQVASKLNHIVEVVGYRNSYDGITCLPDGSLVDSTCASSEEDLNEAIKLHTSAELSRTPTPSS
jgi:hypothetical protein